MLGKTNSNIGGGGGYENVNVIIQSNQPTTDDLLGASVTLAIAEDGYTETKVWNGGNILFKVPQYASYTVSFGSMEGYATPESHSGIAVADNSVTVTGTYQTSILTVTINTNQSSHADVSGAKATVTSASVSTTLSSGGSVKIPFGESVSLSFSAVDGYATPSTQSFTANAATLSKTGTYNTTILTVNAITNQSSHTDIGSATCTVSASGMDTVTLSNGGTAKVPTGASCTVSWSAVTNYKAPTETFTASGVSQTKTGTYQTELVTVTVTTEDGTSVAGQVITINGNSHTLTAEGTCTQKVAFGTKYSITANAKTNYTTPTSITDRTASQASYPVTMEYKLANETLTVNVSGLTSGFTITVKNSSGAVLGTSTSANKTFSIAKGTVYYVYASSVSGYIVTESFGPYTAVAGNSRTVSVAYTYRPGTTSPSNGVYIKDTDGYYCTIDEWSDTLTADCVAVITSSCRFGFALTEASGTKQMHGSYSGELENYMTAIEDDSAAKADYDGATNTTNIMKLQPSTSYAAGWCNAYTFPSGKSGFLPSLGQMWAAYINKEAVDAALTKAGGAALTSAYYWTSTFWGVSNSRRYCWVLNWIDGYVNYNSLSSGGIRVRPFCSL